MTASLPGPPDRTATGRAGEMLVASRFALYGYQVYLPFADNHGIDLTVGAGEAQHLAVQVKAISYPKTTYAFVYESSFPLVPWMALAVVVFSDPLDTAPPIYLFSAPEWSNPTKLLRHKTADTKPYFHVRLGKDWADELEPWLMTPQHVATVVSQVRSQLKRDPAC
ncbi:DUF4365 domain-containing protein [Mycolicibacter virginiensis]|nr:DUF4365 domain-containing protein [Mycolicibacter virginiensis]